MKQPTHFWLTSVIALVGLMASSPAIAQVVPDATLPNNSSVTIDGNISTITGGTQAGGNLFHSFEQFSIPTGDTAYFNNAVDVQNIFSRVTGRNVSNIDGLIRANDTANLFLINPNGIIFGPNASLNIGGSFVASTANSLNFADSTQFSAKVPQTTPILTVSVPIGLQYGGIAGSILNQSSTFDSSNGLFGLQVQPGKTLVLVGGNVILDSGYLVAPGGRVELGGLAEMGTVGLNIDGNELRLSFPQDVKQADVSLLEAGVYVSSLTDNNGISTTPGGNITINARNIDVLEKSHLDAGAFHAKAGEITLNATGVISITGGIKAYNSSEWYASISSYGIRGDINIKAKVFSLTNASVTTNDYGGNSGNITLQADESISVANSLISNSIGGGETAGEINVQAKKISIIGSSQVNTFGITGVSGNIKVSASDSVSISDSSFNTYAVDNGRGGNITIKAKSLSLTNGGELNASTTGNAASGNIDVFADSITLSGISLYGSSSGLFTNTDGYSTYYGAGGSGGDIKIDTKNLRVLDGAVISARTKGKGNGGNITVNTNTLDMTGGGQLLTTAYSSGGAGDITVNATEGVAISASDPTFADRVDKNFIDPFTGESFSADIDNDGSASGLLSRVQGDQAANAGNIKVQADSIRLDNQGIITAETTLGEGGNITLKGRNIFLQNGSNITTSAGTVSADGNGGNITIDTNLLVPLKNSDITANAFEGTGGNIQINTQGLFLSPDSDITASSALGLSGVVEVNTPNINFSRGLASLPTVPVNTEVAQACTPSGSQQQSEFIVTGRGGLPPSPNDALSSDAISVDWVTLNPDIKNHSSPADVSTKKTESTPAPIIEAQGWVIDDNGDIVLTATPTTATTSIPWLTAANCQTVKTQS